MILKNMSGIYIFYENKILIMKRSKKEFNSVGQYFSIGGKFEPNELNQPKKSRYKIHTQNSSKSKRTKNL